MLAMHQEPKLPPHIQKAIDHIKEISRLSAEGRGVFIGRVNFGPYRVNVFGPSLKKENDNGSELSG